MSRIRGSTSSHPPPPTARVPATWEMDAIRLLRPANVLLYYETLGGSGSPELRAWAAPGGGHVAGGTYKLVVEHVRRSKISLPYMPELPESAKTLLLATWDMMGLGTNINRLALFTFDGARC